MPPAVPPFKNEISHRHEKNRTEPLKNDVVDKTGQAVRLMQTVEKKEGKFLKVMWKRMMGLSRSKGCNSDCSVALDR